MTTTCTDLDERASGERLVWTPVLNHALITLAGDRRRSAQSIADSLSVAAGRLVSADAVRSRARRMGVIIHKDSTRGRTFWTPQMVSQLRDLLSVHQPNIAARTLTVRHGRTVTTKAVMVARGRYLADDRVAA